MNTSRRTTHGNEKPDLLHERIQGYREGYRQSSQSQPDFLSTQTATSTRAVGDAIQTILCEHFRSLIGDLCSEYCSDVRRAMTDLAFTDKDGFYYIVDVKTHRLGTHFKMPNLTSLERLARFYEDDKCQGWTKIHPLWPVEYFPTPCLGFLLGLV